MKYFIALAALGPVLIVAIWVMFEGRSTRNDTNRTQSRPSELNARVPTTNFGPPSTQSPGKGKSIRRGAVEPPPVYMPPEVIAQRERMNQVLARAAAVTTEAVRRDMLNNAMEKRRLPFEKLFHSWNFTDDEADAIFSIVRAREEKLIGYRMETAEKGVDHVLVAQKKIDAERATAATVILTLLGRDRFDEFSRVESDIFPPRTASRR